MGVMSVSTRARGAYAKSAVRREEILASALTVFGEKGLDGLSLTAIAEVVGVSREALRYYFSSREELLLALIDARDARSIAVVSDLSPDESLMRHVEASIELQRGDKGLVSLYLSLAATASHGSESTRKFFADRFAQMRTNIAEAICVDQDRGRIRSDLPAPILSALIIAAMDGLQEQWLLDEAVDVAAGLRALEVLLTPTSTAQEGRTGEPQSRQVTREVVE